MDSNRDNQRKRFFTFSTKAINIYELVSPTELSLSLTVTSLSSVNGLEDILYFGGYFYAVGLNSLYVVDINNQSDIQVREGKLNGTCTQL